MGPQPFVAALPQRVRVHHLALLAVMATALHMDSDAGTNYGASSRVTTHLP